MLADTLVEIYRIVLTQYGIAGCYHIRYAPDGPGWVRVEDEWENILVEGTPENVLHQARQW